MKRWLIILAILCLPVSAFAGPEVFMMSHPAAGGGGAGCNGQTPTGCILRETFEGSTTCWSGSSYTNCDNVWVNTYAGAQAVYNYATSPAPLQGSHSLWVQNADAQVAFTGTDHVFVGYVLNFTNINDYADHISVTDASYNILCGMEIPSGTTNFYLDNTGGTGQSTSAGSAATATTVYVILEAQKGTGSNAVCKLSYSSTGASGSWTTVTSSNGTWTAQPAGIKIHGDSIAGSYIYDDIRVNATTFNFN